MSLPLRHLARAVNVMDSPFNAWGDNYHDDTGALLSAFGAVKAAGGGAVWLPHGTYLCGEQINLDGSVPIAFTGEAPSGYDNGTVVAYTGSGWAFNSTLAAYPALQENGPFAAFADLTVKLLGTSPTGGINAWFLPVSLRGQVRVIGNNALGTYVGTGIQIGPSQNQCICSFDQLQVAFLNKGAVLESDHLTGRFLNAYDCEFAPLQIGATTGSAQMHIDVAHLGINQTHGATSGNCITVLASCYGGIDKVHFEGAGVTRLLNWAAAAQQNPLFRIGAVEGNLAQGFGSFALEAGMVSPAFGHVDIPLLSGYSWAVTTPAAPTQTGSGHAVKNTEGTRVVVYLDGTQSGTHLVDFIGVDHVLPSEPKSVELGRGDSIYFATTCPTSWRWFRPN